VHILFVTSEFHPLAKSGGLADAVAALAKALALRDHRVTVVMPRYRTVPSEGFRDLGIPVGVPLGYREEWIGVHHGEAKGVRIYLLDHQQFFDREGIYGPSAASAYGDNLRRFSLLSRGALQLSLALDLQPDIIHAHDWPTALVPVFLKTEYEQLLEQIGLVFSIHNFGYHGWWPRGEVNHTGLAGEHLHTGGLLQGTEINLVRGAITTADRIVAVSPRYAREITEPEYSFGLHEETRQLNGRLTGILNGVDTTEWNPRTDPLIAQQYSEVDLAGKAACKGTLQREFGLSFNPDIPVIGMVTRLTEQKGIGALFGPGYGCLFRICTELSVQVVFLGTGEEWCQEEIRRLADRLPNFSAYIGYSEVLAHRITAGSDFFLMPSTYEPCGLNQMYAMRYGTIPIVTQTGGLADTVDFTVGFHVNRYSPESIFSAVSRAVTVFSSDRPRIKAMRVTGMKQDFSWDRSALQYEQIYREIGRFAGSTAVLGDSA
jgi:starch synthase